MCTPDSSLETYPYLAGTAALVESLKQSKTKHRIVVAMTTSVQNPSRLSAYFGLLGAESCLVSNIDIPDLDAVSMHGLKQRHSIRRHYAGAHNTLMHGGHNRDVGLVGRRRLGSGGGRWSGMFSKLMLFAPGALDKIVYLDVDHIVLKNIDRIIDLCQDGLCGTNDPTQMNKLWCVLFRQGGGGAKAQDTMGHG